jgi:hypothetical protein
MRPKVKVLLEFDGSNNYKIAQIKNAVLVHVPIAEKNPRTIEMRKGESIPEYAAQYLVDSFRTYEVTVK